MIPSLILYNYLLPNKQGQIVHRSGLNNENIQSKDRKYLEIKIKDFIFNSIMVKADIF